MTSVTGRVRTYKQPYGGFVNLSVFTYKHFFDDVVLHEENIHPSTIGMVVDYLTRFIIGKSPSSVFSVSTRGAYLMGEEEYNKAKKLLSSITDLNHGSVISACKLVHYDQVIRAGLLASGKDAKIPDSKTINNIIAMVKRSQKFITKNGPLVADGFTFEGGYTDIISSGDGDYIFGDSIVDFKVSKNKPTSKNILQLIVYWRMGLHSIHSYFQNINKIIIFNPRLNDAWTLDVNDIPDKVIKEIEKDVIGYDGTETPDILETHRNKLKKLLSDYKKETKRDRDVLRFIRKYNSLEDQYFHLEMKVYGFDTYMRMQDVPFKNRQEYTRFVSSMIDSLSENNDFNKPEVCKWIVENFDEYAIGKIPARFFKTDWCYTLIPYLVDLIPQNVNLQKTYEKYIMNDAESTINEVPEKYRNKRVYLECLKKKNGTKAKISFYNSIPKKIRNSSFRKMINKELIKSPNFIDYVNSQE